MIFQKNTLVYMALGASVLSLGACSYNHPNAMPGGYTYHHEEYKSPTPPASSKITVEQRKYMDSAQAEQFRDAVYDLLERLTMRAGMPPKPVYIMAPDPMTTFYANLDNDLRESMRHIGYAISDTPTDAYIFTYEALPIGKEGSETIQTGANNVYLTLRVFDSLSEEALQLTEESGQYFIQGAEALNIAPSRYNLLPSKEKVIEEQIKQQVHVKEPQYVAPPVVPAVPSAPSAPVSTMVEPVQNIAPLSVVPEPVKKMPTEPLLSEPVQDIEVKPAPKKTRAKKVSEAVSKVTKKPSHDDIVIINRGDKPSMEDGQALPTLEAPEPNALQDAIPTAEKAVRGRVSTPSDY